MAHLPTANGGTYGPPIFTRSKALACGGLEGAARALTAAQCRHSVSGVGVVRGRGPPESLDTCAD